MASSFENVGLGMLGSERRFMGGDNPLAEALKGVKTGLMVKAIGESGLGDFLSGIGKTPVPPPTVQSMGGILGQTGSYGGISPIAGTPTEEQPKPANTDDDFHQEFNLKPVSQSINSQSYTTPNQLVPANQSESQNVLAMANQPVAPPGGMNLPQYGQKKGSSIGPVANAVLSFLPKLFGMA